MRVLLKIYVTHLIVTPTSKSRSAAEMIVLMAQTKKTHTLQTQEILCNIMTLTATETQQNLIYLKSRLQHN